MKKMLSAAISLILISGVFGQDYKFSGNISSMWGIYIPTSEKSGELSIGDTDLTASIELYKGNGTVFAQGKVGYDAVMKKFTPKLCEAYFDYTSSFWGIRIGSQKIVWGKADEIDITNSVFPSDSTSLFLDDDTLAVNAARLSFTGSIFTVDTYWVPLFRGNKLPFDDDSPLRDVLIPKTAKIPMADKELIIPVGTGQMNKPECRIQNGEYGIKASTYLPLCDISVYGFYGFDKTPILNYEMQTSFNNLIGMKVPSGISITGEYKRMTMIGFDAAFPMGSTVLRIENACFPQRYLQSSTEAILSGGKNSTRKNQFMGLAGIDWMPSNWTFTAQYFYDVVPGEISKLDRTHTFMHGGTVSISRTFLQETLEFSFGGVIAFNDFDSAINFEAKYSATDQLKISAGSYSFLPGPTKDGTYGKFKDLCTAFIKVQYDF